MFDYDKLVGSIYDCAANPDLWSATLNRVRDEIGTAYVMVGYSDTSPTLHQQQPIFTFQHSEWDHERLVELESWAQQVPGTETLLDGSIDRAWTMMGQLPFAEFKKTDFYKGWMAPQGLTDNVVVPFLCRKHVFGLFSSVLHISKGNEVSVGQCRLAERLSPHIRRAMMINEIVDKGYLALALYRKVLDTLSVPIFIVGAGQRLVFCNASADELLSGGSYFTAPAGILKARQVAGQPTALDDALDRAAMGDVAVGISGIGIPLIGKHGDRAAAYVLPIAGNDIRRALGLGHCAVFVAQRGEQQPMGIEILRTMFDLTVQEARVATLIAKGDGPQAIAEALNVSVNTVRSHLQHAFAKTSVSDQSALGALVNGLMPPVA